MCGGAIISGDIQATSRSGGRKLTKKDLWTGFDTISELWGFNFSNGKEQCTPADHKASIMTMVSNKEPNEKGKKASLRPRKNMYRGIRQAVGKMGQLKFATHRRVQESGSGPSTLLKKQPALMMRLPSASVATRLSSTLVRSCLHPPPPSPPAAAATQPEQPPPKKGCFISELPSQLQTSEPNMQTPMMMASDEEFKDQIKKLESFLGLEPKVTQFGDITEPDSVDLWMMGDIWSFELASRIKYLFS